MQQRVHAIFKVCSPPKKVLLTLPIITLQRIEYVMSSLVPRPHPGFRCLQYVQFFAHAQREPVSEAMLWGLSILAPFSISSFTMSSRPWYAAQCKAVPPSLLSLQWSTLRRWLFSHFWTWCVYPPLMDICNSKKIKLYCNSTSRTQLYSCTYQGLVYLSTVAVN